MKFKRFMGPPMSANIVHSVGKAERPRTYHDNVVVLHVARDANASFI